MAIEWFLKVGDRVHGPLSAAELRQNAAAGLIGPETPIRKGADGQWVRAEKVRGLFSRDDSLPLPAPPPPQLPPVPPQPPVHSSAGVADKPTVIPAELTTNAPAQRVHPWIRFLARFIDTYCVTLAIAFPVGFFIGVLLGVICPAAAKWDEFLLESLLGMVLFFAYCFIEPIFFAVFGTTPGKALLGIDVRTQSGDRLSYGQAMKRSLRVWFYGLGMGIAIVQFFTLWTAYANLKQQGITRWDRKGNFHVSHRRISVLKGTIATVLIVSLIGLMGNLRSMAENQRRNEILKSVNLSQQQRAATQADFSPIVPSAPPVQQAAQLKQAQWQPPADAQPVPPAGTIPPPPDDSGIVPVQPQQPAPSPPPLSPKDADTVILSDNNVYEKIVPSVVIICSFRGKTPIGIGSGFVLDPGDRIVTNEHVIRGASIAEVHNHRGESCKVMRVMAVDEDRDIAVLLISPLAGMPGLRLADVPPKVGDPVFALGSPKGLGFTFTKGIVSQFRRNFGPYGSVVQTDVSLSFGSSGSPLVDHHGQVVGVNTLASRSVAEAHNLNFAVSAEEIAAVCKRQKRCALSELKSYLQYKPEIEPPHDPARDVFQTQEQRKAAEKAAEAARWREWTKADGTVIGRARFCWMTAAGKIRLKRENGEGVSLTLDDLSEADQAWVHKAGLEAKREAQKAAGKLAKEAEQRRAAEQKRVAAEQKPAADLKGRWKQLRLGMSPTDVERFLGAPSSVHTYDAINNMTWDFQYGGGIIGGHVSFTNGRLDGWSEPNWD